MEVSIMANEIIMNISKKNIINNSEKYGISDIIGLCDRVLGVMSYDVTDEEYNFLVETVYGDTHYDDLPTAYLRKAAKAIKEWLADC